MATFDSDGLILDARNFRDRHMILAVLTPQHGQIRGVWRNARGGRAPQGSAAQVLSTVRVSVYRSPAADMASIRTVDPVRSSFPLASVVTRASAAAAIAETLAAFCPLEEPAPRRFRLGVAALDALLAGVNHDAVLAYVQFWCLRLGGLLPDDESPEGWLAAGGRVVTSLDLSRLATFLRTPPQDLEGTVNPGLEAWLDEAIRIHAEMPLRALAFHRRMTASEGP